MATNVPGRMAVDWREQNQFCIACGKLFSLYVDADLLLLFDVLPGTVVRVSVGSRGLNSRHELLQRSGLVEDVGRC